MSLAVSLVDTRMMSQQAWLDARRKIIGGSDIAKILGLSKYGTAFTVYLDKRGELPRDEAGEPAYWGTELEPVVAKEFTKRTGKKVRRRNAILTHPEYPWMGANIDRELVGEKVGLECKTASAYLTQLWDGDEVPDEYYAQCQWYMAVTGYDAWWIAVLIGGQRFVNKLVKRDEAFIETAIQIASNFWNHHVVPGIPPAMDGSSVASEYLTKAHPRSNGFEVNLPPDAQALVERYLDAKQDVAEADDRVSLYENQLKELMGDYEVGHVAEHKVSWKTVVSNRVDTRSLQAERPDIYETFLKTSESRRFSVK